jgi:hypothetical protein
MSTCAGSKTSAPPAPTVMLAEFGKLFVTVTCVCELVT